LSSSAAAAACTGAGAGAEEEAAFVVVGRKTPGAEGFAVAEGGVLPNAVAVVAAAAPDEETLGSVSGAERASPSFPKMAVARLGLLFFCCS